MFTFLYYRALFACLSEKQTVQQHVRQDEQKMIEKSSFYINQFAVLKSRLWIKIDL